MAGHVPFKPDMSALVKPGKVGVDYTVEEANALARFIGLELVSTIKGNVGDLDKVRRIVKVVGFVNCPDDFGDQPEVLNGCSDLMEEIFGRERGVHARSALHPKDLAQAVNYDRAPARSGMAVQDERGIDVENAKSIGVSSFESCLKRQNLAFLHLNFVSDTETSFQTPFDTVFDNYGPRAWSVWAVSISVVSLPSHASSWSGHDALPARRIAT